ncbi:MAG: YuiA family protein [Minicystis sp.]
MSTTILAVLNLILVAVVVVGFAACHRELRIIRRGLGAIDEGHGRRTAAIVVGLQGLREPLEAIRAGVEELSPNRRDTVEQRGPLPPSAVVPASKATIPAPTGLRLDLPRASEEDRDSEGETRLMRPPTAAELAAAGAVRPAESPDPPALAAGLGRPRGRLAPPGTTPHPPPVKRDATVMGLPPPASAPPQSTYRPPPPGSGPVAASRRTGSGTLMSMPAQVAPSSGSAPKVALKAVCRLCEGSGVVRIRSGGLEDCRGCGGSGYIDPAVAPSGGDEREARLPG